MIRRDDSADNPPYDAIETLANESGQPIGVVAEVYQAEYARLKADANVHDFLVLFATRRAREVLARTPGS